MRNTIDFSPYRRSTVGFDHLFDMFERSARAEAGDSYPPFDIRHDGEDGYLITLAVAGFDPAEIEVMAQQNQLIVSGRKGEEADSGQHYLHRGIATRPFERRFQLADFIQVRSATFENGLLSIALEREIPETMKPRKIEIGGAKVRQLDTTRKESRKAA